MSVSSNNSIDYSLSQLLPYDPSTKKNKDLRSGLKEYQLLLNLLKDANDAMKKGDLKKFDALVGENACEIRAIWISIIAAKNLIDTENLAEKIAKAEQQLETLLIPKNIDSLMKAGTSLKDLLDKDNLNISLTLEETTSLQSYILTVVRVPSATDSKIVSLFKLATTDAKRLKAFGDVSSKFTDNLESRVRKLLSTASVKFVQKTAAELSDASLIEMNSDKLVMKHNNCWPCTPMYWTYKTVLQAAQKEKIPLIIHALFLNKQKDAEDIYEVKNEEYLYFSAEGKDENYQLSTPIPQDLEKPACMVQGIVYPQDESTTLSEWKHKMSKLKVTDAILACAADHRQYPDVKKDQIFENYPNKEFETYKIYAKKEGFSLENPSTFFIQHVYPTKVAHVMPLTKQALHKF